MATGPSRTQTSLAVSSPSIQEDRPIPARHTCEGKDVSPVIRINNVPGDAKAIALILEDPDAPGGTFTHWTAWNLPSGTREIPEGADIESFGGKEGQNSFGRRGYQGPCPPPGSTHRYHFRFYALSSPLDLIAGASRRALEDAIKGKILAEGSLVATYHRNG